MLSSKDVVMSCNLIMRLRQPPENRMLVEAEQAGNFYLRLAA
jgi:hypothetical protein